MNKTAAREKARSLVAQMTRQEKVSQMLYTSPAIERLGIPSYNWWNEALHGVARAGLSTVFPQSIGLSATFDPALLEEVGRITGTEGRLKHALYSREGDHGIYKGLTYWSPNINIVRDPRWGRAHETYGEDPYLTSRMGGAFVRGLQGADPERLLAAACVKHFAVHSGPEEIRHGFNAAVSRKDMAETYFPAFERIIRDEDVAGVMTAYNAINGIPSTCHEELIRDVIRGEWGFDGYVVSDCGAVSDICERHHYADTRPQAAALSAKAGVEMNCGTMFGYLQEALAQGLLEESVIDEAVEDLLTIRLRLDMEAEEEFSEAEILEQWLQKMPEWEQLNRRAAEESLVLLKNDGILPLKTPQTMAVIGPNSDSRSVLPGNYHGTSGELTTVLEGLRQRFTGTKILYSEGAHLYKDRIEGCDPLPGDRISEARAFAKFADVTVVVLGLDPSIEGELGDASNEYAAGDKHNLYLPKGQQELLKAVCDVTDNVIVVLMSGGALDLKEENDRVRAVVQAWYPGAAGGWAIARVLAGDANPTGRLPVTFYHGDQVTWDFSDYSMTGKTYRFFNGKPLYPFGYGLSYEYLTLSEIQVNGTVGNTLACEDLKESTDVSVSLQVQNPHDHAVSMPLLVLVHWEDEPTAPQKQLVGVQMVSLNAGQQAEIHFPVSMYWLSIVTEEGVRRLPKGTITFEVCDHVSG